MHKKCKIPLIFSHSAGTGIGLKYICNTHLNNIVNGFDIAVTDIGIELNQGSISSAAGNKFSLGTGASGAPKGSDFNNASKSQINYYFDSDAFAKKEFDYNFEYHTTDKTLNGESELLVRNPLGQVIKRIKMTSDGLISWNIENLSSGIYYYSLENTDKIIIAAQQLIIAR